MRDPRSELAADRPGMEIANAFIAGKLVGDTIDADLAFKLFPKNDQTGAWVLVQMVALFAVIISIENEPIVAVTL